MSTPTPIVIRPGTFSDMEKVMEIIEAFYNETLFKTALNEKLDTEYARAVAAGCIVNTDTAMMLVGDKNGEIVGVICGMLIPHMCFKDKLIAIEPIWYVKSNHRSSGLGLQLLTRYTEWAKAKGSKWASVDCMDDATGSLMVSLGYKLMERKYVKGLV